MAWWSKEDDAKESHSEAEKAEAETRRKDADGAIDTVAQICRLLGEAARGTGDDVESFRSKAESWAKHVLVIAPAPGSADENRGKRRDWPGVRRFVQAAIESQREQADQATADLREIVKAFSKNMSKVVQEGSKSDDSMNQQLERLRAVADAESLEKIREETLQVAGEISKVMEERKVQQRQKMAELGEELRRMGAQLEDARREGALDALTRVSNRKAFDEYISTTTDLATLTGNPCAFLFVDIDHFKKVNDTRGHLAGDEALRKVSECLVGSFPRRGDFVARYGGEEFAVVLRDTPLDAARMLAERLRKRVAATQVRFEGKEFAVQVSIGVSQLADGETVESWIKRTDEALYRAKDSGRNKCVLANNPDGSEAPTGPPSKAGSFRVRVTAR